MPKTEYPCSKMRGAVETCPLFRETELLRAALGRLMPNGCDDCKKSFDCDNASDKVVICYDIET